MAASRNTRATATKVCRPDRLATASSISCMNLNGRRGPGSVKSSVGEQNPLHQSIINHRKCAKESRETKGMERDWLATEGTTVMGGRDEPERRMHSWIHTEDMFQVSRVAQRPAHRLLSSQQRMACTPATWCIVSCSVLVTLTKEDARRRAGERRACRAGNRDRRLL
jgi:hypothetical protein